jgi:hypothetical protein
MRQDVRIIAFIVSLVVLSVLAIQLVLLRHRLEEYMLEDNFYNYCISRGHKTYISDRFDTDEIFLRCTK